MTKNSKLLIVIKKTSKFILILILLQGVYAISSISAQSPSETRWGPPVKIYETEGTILLNPLLLSDDMGRLHLFWGEHIIDDADSAQESEIYVINYMMWENDRWVGPVDILAVKEQISGLTGAIDGDGYITLIYGRLNQPIRSIQSFTLEALSANEWSNTSILSRGPQMGGGLASTIDGTRHLLYSDMKGDVVHENILKESEPTDYSNDNIAYLPPGYLLRKTASVHIDESETVHAILPSMFFGDFSDVSENKSDIKSFYLKSEDQGLTWSEPYLLTPKDGESWAITSDQQGVLHTLYIGRAGVGGRYHRWSADGGDSWEEPVTITEPHEGAGLSGGDLVVDSGNILHATFSLFGEDDAMIVHSQWNGVEWNQWQELSVGIPGHMERPTIEVTHGNLLHTIWESDLNSIWYAQGESRAPAIDVEPFKPNEEDELEISPTVEPTPMPEVESQPTRAFSEFNDDPPGQFNTLNNVWSLMIPIVIVILFIVVVLILRNIFRR